MPDPLDQEMEFWMQEIERFENEDRIQSVRRGRPQRENDQPVEVPREELEQANPLDLIFVPDDWMIQGN